MNERIHNVTLTGTELVLLENLLSEKICTLQLEFNLILNTASDKSKAQLLKDANSKMNFLSGILSKLRC